MRRTWTVGAVMAAAMLGVGCGGPSSGDAFGPSPDFAELQGELTHPTGTFAAGKESAILAGYAAESRVAPTAAVGMSSILQASGVDLQADAQFRPGAGGIDVDSACPGLRKSATGSCACPGGGSLTWDATSLEGAGDPVDALVKLRADACAFPEATVDGFEFLELQGPRASPEVLLDVHTGVVERPDSAHVDLDLGTADHQSWLLFPVDDGTVLVAARAGWDPGARTGLLTVRDKQETWTCNLNGGAGACTSDRGGTRQVH